MVWLRENLPPDSFITTGAGNFSAWVHRFYRFRRFATHIGPCSGSMGYGVPSALGLKRAFPERTVVCFAGDGDFLMNGQEFMTAVQYDIAFIIVVVDNGTYGTIRMHQERDFPERVSGTALTNPDFVQLARAYGWRAERVDTTAQFEPAFARALEAGGPTLLHVLLPADVSTSRTTLAALRETALARTRG